MTPFRFVTRLGDLLDFDAVQTGDGGTVSWSDEVGLGVAEHVVLQRKGALHEITHTPPKKHAFRCILAGGDVQARYRRLVSTLQLCPDGTLEHPRFGAQPAICLKISASENPGDQTDLIEYSIEFVEDGLSDVQRESAGSAAQRATAEASTLTAVAATASPAVQDQVAGIVDQVTLYSAVAVRAEQGGSTAEELDLSLQAVLDDVQQLAALPGVSYAVTAQAALVADAARAAKLALYASRPPVIEYELPTAMTLPRLAGLLYGGRRARAMAAEIRRLTLISDTLLPAGTRLPIPDPQVVKRNG